jgi:hypothetical protein
MSFIDFDLLIDQYMTSVVEEKENKQECKHEPIIIDKNTFCKNCGIEIVIDNVPEYGFHQVRARKVQGIIDDLQKLGFTGKIADIANGIYLEISDGKIYRGNSRKSIVFACIYNAYKLVHNPQSFNTLLNVFNINRKSALKGIKLVAYHAPSYCIEIDESIIVKQILVEFDSYNDDYYNSILSIYKNIQDKSSLINRSRPTSVVCGLIYYFILSSGKHIDINYYSEKNALSILTIYKICKAIDLILETNYFDNAKI